MTMTTHNSKGAPVPAAPAGRRVIKVPNRAIAAARAQVAISKTLGRPVSDTVRKFADIR